MKDDARTKTGVKKRSGIISSIMILVSCTLYIVLIVATVRTNFQYQAMVTAMDEYIGCEQNAAMLSAGSDYLTEQVQSCVATGDPSHMRSYLTEANVTRRRERALKQLGSSVSAKTISYLQEALDRSNELMDAELYAMRLTMSAYGYPDAALPQELLEISLSKEDAASSKEEKLEQALDLVFGTHYQFEKDKIATDIRRFLNNAVSVTRRNQQQSTEALHKIMMIQQVLLSLLLVQSVITFFIIILRSMHKQKENKVFISQIIHSFAKSIDIKDKYTNGHSFRVATYARMIAKKAGFRPSEAEEVYNIGLLHDIGKITVPDEILHKPSRLSDEEFDVMKRHTTNGSEILQAIEIAPELALGAEYHHERIDGRGYPTGRKGDEIPQVAQIIAVADTFDAMYSTRPYRKQMPIEEVVEELKRVSGTQLNTRYVNALVELIGEGALDAG